MQIPVKKNVVFANCFAVGGMIGLGKSTLVAGIAKALNAKPVFELDDNDEVQQVLLKSLYEGKRSQSPDVFQLDFLLTRALRYKTEIANKKTPIFDRTIFEDLLFAYQCMGKVPHRFRYYQQLWAQEVNALVYTYGVPRKYILLEASFSVFKARLFARDRVVEIDNYDQNEDYFKALHKVYIPFMKSILEEYGIIYKVLDATLSKEALLQAALTFLQAK